MSDSEQSNPPQGAVEEPPERASARAKLPIPLQAKIGRAPSREVRLRDVSVSGFQIEWPTEAEIGETAILRFEGYPGVCPALILLGQVVRIVGGESPGLGIALDRAGSSPQALGHFRQLVLHYMHHRPLLDEVVRDFFEGRCESCNWIGRVGARAPVCPRCGERVRELDPGQ